MPIIVYHSTYRKKKFSLFLFAIKFNWETIYIYVFVSDIFDRNM